MKPAKVESHWTEEVTEGQQDHWGSTQCGQQPIKERPHMFNHDVTIICTCNVVTIYIPKHHQPQPRQKEEEVSVGPKFA